MSDPAAGPTSGRAPTPPPADAGWLLRAVHDQRIAFLLVGAANTGIGFGLFVLFDRVFTGIAPAWSGVRHNTLTLLCAHVVSVVIAFVLHRTLVFRVTGHLWRDLARFESVNLAALGLNWLLLNALTVWRGLAPVLAQAIVTAVIAVASFVGHKHFSFRRHADPHGRREEAGG